MLCNGKEKKIMMALSDSLYMGCLYFVNTYIGTISKKPFKYVEYSFSLFSLFYIATALKFIMFSNLFKQFVKNKFLLLLFNQ